MHQNLIIELKKAKKKITSVEGTIQSDYATLATDDVKYLFKNDRPKYKRTYQRLFTHSNSKIIF